MKVSRRRDREIFRQTALALRPSGAKAPNHRHTGVFRGFGNEELAEKIRSRRGLSFTPGS